MVRYQVTLAYDGTDFLGFQRQAKGRTVQGALEQALRQLGWQGRSILAAGRTDTGVHASGQVVAFDLDWGHSPDDLKNALNASLPFDIAATAILVADPEFHPRLDAVGRRYRYRIYCRDQRDPLRDRYAWRVWPELEPEQLHEFARHLVGKHDFAAFGTPPRSGGKTVRHVSHAHWDVQDDEYTFEMLADGFLYHMVRRLVNAQVQAGQGKVAKEKYIARLDGGSRELVQGLAPPQGLNLVEVIYPVE